MIIAIGGDHASPDLKKAIMDKFGAEGIVFNNFGTNDHGSVDYPDFGHPVAKSVLDGSADLGIVICGSGNGTNRLKRQGCIDAATQNCRHLLRNRQINQCHILIWIKTGRAHQMFGDCPPLNARHMANGFTGEISK